MNLNPYSLEQEIRLRQAQIRDDYRRSQEVSNAVLRACRLLAQLAHHRWRIRGAEVEPGNPLVLTDERTSDQLIGMGTAARFERQASDGSTH